ncbi:acyl-CoA N-acyltransferase, partial [Pisolithus marmoratus]
MASSMSVGEFHSAINFRFPVQEVENDRVKLVPFVPSLHAELFLQGSVNHPELFRFLPYGPFDSTAAFIEGLIEGFISPDPGASLYTIIDKTRSLPQSPSPSEVDFAGVIGYINTDTTHLKTEIGAITILPPFQRTHVTTNAVGLLMEYALNPPLLSGLGLRRVQWQTNELNSQSIRAAERMGFKREGILRWDRTLPSGKGKPGDPVQSRAGDPKPDWVGRHTAILAICWDDWENGGREEVQRLMARRN